MIRKPVDGRYKTLSANTNPTVKNMFDDGKKVIIIMLKPCKRKKSVTKRMKVLKFLQKFSRL